MERRDFIKTSIMSTGLLAISSVFATEQKSKNFLIQIQHKADFQSTNDIQLYTPLPHISSSQKISNFKITGNFTHHSFKETHNALFLNTCFNSNTKEKILNLSFNCSVSEQGIARNKQNEEIEFLEQSKYIQTNEEIQKIINHLTKISTQQQQILFLSQFINEQIKINNNLNNFVENKNGKKILIGQNVNANSLFSVLCKNIKIPSREVFGLQIQKNNHFAFNNKAQVLLNNEWKTFDFNTNGSKMDFIAINYLRDINLDGLYMPNAYRTFGSIDGNNLKYYKNFYETISIQPIS